MGDEEKRERDGKTANKERKKERKERERERERRREDLSPARAAAAIRHSAASHFMAEGFFCQC